MEEAILSEGSVNQVCAGDLVIVLLIKVTISGSCFSPYWRGDFFFLLKFIVWGCLVFLAGSHLTGTFLLKAIISLYSTVCASRLLSGLFAFKASSQVTAYIRGSSSLWMQMLPAGVRTGLGVTDHQARPVVSVICLVFYITLDIIKSIVLPFQILAIHCHLLSPFVS